MGSVSHLNKNALRDKYCKMVNVLIEHKNARKVRYDRMDSVGCLHSNLHLAQAEDLHLKVQRLNQGSKGRVHSLILANSSGRASILTSSSHSNKQTLHSCSD